jgi:hypothetical protein
MSSHSPKETLTLASTHGAKLAPPNVAKQVGGEGGGGGAGGVGGVGGGGVGGGGRGGLGGVGGVGSGGVGGGGEGAGLSQHRNTPPVSGGEALAPSAIVASWLYETAPPVM